MGPEEVLEQALALPATTLEWPFGDGYRVAALQGRLVVLVPEPTARWPQARFNAKCDPELALELRERFGGITPGWHMNKRHWNTVALDGSVPDELIRWIVGH